MENTKTYENIDGKIGKIIEHVPNLTSISALEFELAAVEDGISRGQARKVEIQKDIAGLKGVGVLSDAVSEAVSDQEVVIEDQEK